MTRIAAGIPAILIAADLDPALHLEPEEPPCRVDDEEVELPLDNGTGTLAWKDDAPGVEDGPVVREVAFESGEHLAFGFGGVGVGPGRKHPGHGCFIPRVPTRMTLRCTIS